jgi:predicted HTH domain antitoxin
MERMSDAKPSVPLMTALKMFELGKLSSGKAAELAGMSRVEFLEACGRYRVSVFNYPDDEIEAELVSDLDAIDKICKQVQRLAGEQDT